MELNSLNKEHPCENIPVGVQGSGELVKIKKYITKAHYEQI